MALEAANRALEVANRALEAANRARAILPCLYQKTGPLPTLALPLLSTPPPRKVRTPPPLQRYRQLQLHPRRPAVYGLRISLTSCGAEEFVGDQKF
jgi:hypothetical protein